MTELRKEFKKYYPETIGETDRAFDDGNYIEWLEKELTEARSKLKNYDYLGDVRGRFYSKEEIEMIKRECYEDGREEGAYDI